MITKYSIIILYFAILFVIGLLASKRIHGLKDFYVGGKNLGYWVVAFSARATGESAWLLLGLTGLGAAIGFKAFWVVLGEVLGVGFCWLVMAKPFKNLTDEYDSITIPDYLESRFKSKTHLLRIISALVLSLFVTIYVSAQIDATGSAFESFLGWNYHLGAIVGFLIVVAYIFTGGFVAVAWSDLFQGLMMLIGLVLLPIVAYFAVINNGNGQIINSLQNIDPSLLSFWGEGGMTFINILEIVGFLMIGIGFLGSPQIFVRFISIKNMNEINKGRWVAIIFTILTDSAAVLAGIYGRILLTSPTDDVNEVLGNGAQNVLPILVENIFPVILVSFYIAVVLSAIMSTIDSLLVVASSAVTRDFYQQILHPEIDEKDLAKFSRIVTLLLAFGALLVAITVSLLSPTRTVFWFVIFGWSGIAASFCPMMILSLFWNNYTEKGAIASMISGFLSVPFFKFVMPNIEGIGLYFDKLSELPPSFFVSLLIGIIVSLSSSKAEEKVNT